MFHSSRNHSSFDNAVLFVSDIMTGAVSCKHLNDGIVCLSRHSSDLTKIKDGCHREEL